jgi:hypothetical protein
VLLIIKAGGTYDDDHVDGGRLYLWAAATNGPIVQIPGDVWAWGTMVEWYRQGKIPDSSTRALWQFYQQNYLVVKQEVWEIMKFALRNISFLLSKGSLTCRKILRHGADSCWFRKEYVKPYLVSHVSYVRSGNLSNAKHESCNCDRPGIRLLSIRVLACRAM